MIDYVIIPTVHAPSYNHTTLIICLPSYARLRRDSPGKVTRGHDLAFLRTHQKLGQARLYALYSSFLRMHLIRNCPNVIVNGDMGKLSIV